MSRNLIGILALTVLAGCDQEDREDSIAGSGEDYRALAWAKDTAGHFQDPVCAQSVPASTPWKRVYRGRLYYFHSGDCRIQFSESPLSYAGTPAHHHRTP